MDKPRDRKIKSSRHHEERLWDHKYPKHGLPIEGCYHIVNNYDSVTRQDNGRFLYVGRYLGDMHEVVVSAATSAGLGGVITQIDRIITAYTTEEGDYYISTWTPP